MVKTLKRPISILLALLMVAGMFTALPLTASAEDSEASELIAGHSLTLDGNIGINFYIDPSAAGLTPAEVNSDNFSYSFAWEDGNAIVDVAAQADNQAFTDEGNYIKVSCKVCAAEMTCGVRATFTLGGETETEVYSVKDYGNKVINASESEISTLFGVAKYKKLLPLVTNMLDYGAKAQTVFGIKTDDLANAGLSYSMTDVSPEMFDEAIQTANGGQADDISALAPTFGASFKAPSLVFLSENTLRLYFEMADASFSTAGLTKWNDYYYAQVENIAAANLDMLQTFSVSGTTLHYSALDYAKALAESENADQAALAKSLYWYNQAANTYFAPEHIVDLSALEGDYQAQDGDVLTGTLAGNKRITVAPNAAITLRDVNITSLNASYAGITPDGNATITLEGANTVRGGHQYYPGIYARTGYTLTIDGAGSLTASSKGRGAGIGGGYQIACGNIVINGGNITATGGNTSEGYAAGIGGGYKSTCGTITINGGTVTATGGRAGAGIGSGYSSSSCGAITISGGTVTASGGQGGSGGAGIGSGRMSSCDSVTISGGTVNATGVQGGAGIGSGSRASCGAVTITAAVTQVTATKGNRNSDSIGKAYDGSCGTVTIEPGANVIQN